MNGGPHDGHFVSVPVIPVESVNDSLSVVQFAELLDPVLWIVFQSHWEKYQFQLTLSGGCYVHQGAFDSVAKNSDELQNRPSPQYSFRKEES